MKRRQLLIAGLAGIGGVLAVSLGLASAESAIAKAVFKRLGYLQLDEAGVHEFARDLNAHQVVSKGRLRVIDASGPLYTGNALAVHNKVFDAIHHGEDRITTLYLMSSDFFKNGADVNRIVRYLGYYDPVIACNNPFARPALS
jgi:hypothetical protein